MKHYVLCMVDDDFAEGARGVIGSDDGPQGDEIGPVVAVQIVTNVEESVGRGVPIQPRVQRRLGNEGLVPPCEVGGKKIDA